MIALIGALCSMLVFAGGFQASTDLLAGLLLTAFGVIGLGTIVAYLQDTGHPFDGVIAPGVLSVGQLNQFIGNNPATVFADTKVYVGDSGLHPAGVVFSCILDGHRAVVIERRVELADTAHDLF